MLADPPRFLYDQTTRLRPGVWIIRHFNLDISIWGMNAPKYYMGYPYLGNIDDELNCYGVCDTPEQFLTRYADKLHADPRSFMMSFTHAEKAPENRGLGGGWRWHKWGPYIGNGKPKYEYLDDEDEFQGGVYVYHVYQWDGPELKATA